MRHDLAEDPAVIGIASKLALGTDAIVGKLHRLWSWADRQTEDGRVRNVSRDWVDNYVSVHGFADAMCSEKWLVCDVNGGIKFPNFDRHNGESAKRRDAETLRKRDYRERNKPVRKVSQKNRDKSGTKSALEKSREEKSNTTSLRSVDSAPASRQCPASFELTTERFEYAVAQGLTVEATGEEFEVFTDHRYRTPRTKWDLAWKAWVRKAVQIRGAGRSRTGPMTAAEKTDQAFKNVRAMMARQGGALT